MDVGGREGENRGLGSWPAEVKSARKLSVVRVALCSQLVGSTCLELAFLEQSLGETQGYRIIWDIKGNVLQEKPVSVGGSSEREGEKEVSKDDVLAWIDSKETPPMPRI